MRVPWSTNDPDLVNSRYLWFREVPHSRRHGEGNRGTLQSTAIRYDNVCVVVWSLHLGKRHDLHDFYPCAGHLQMRMVFAE
jgi:hypothetical protein